ncbi:MAG: dihydrodipicolinate synthase family protein [Gemmatimonadales bacterium]|nr:dihydrodipicolinate synthase family protein [Gemmatimonadota bacterium]MBP6442738.1 dihydrodipicolinate synthase family protein [Gemmatimonadales bacterium]MBP7622090.1 dihydrodipicolinate synthase family protein [Gemmatimonadales bacterium]
MSSMTAQQWHGVFPAITTPFGPDGKVDHGFLSGHARRLIASGCRGIVALGSLGEGATLTFDEKVEVLRTLVASVGDRVPVVAGISSLSTDEAVSLARAAAGAGCNGLMVLPPYVYQGDWPEMRAHVSAIITATPLSCMLYNNPIAYGTDFIPEHVRQLCEHANLHAIKDSSGDVRRITALRALLGDRLALFVGLDDALLEGVAAGARGWVAGLVNALPDESVLLFEHAAAGRVAEARKLYDWFLPLLRMDTVPKFVQLIKLVQQEVGLGDERVRAPRRVVEGAEREMAMAVIGQALGSRPVAAS